MKGLVESQDKSCTQWAMVSCVSMSNLTRIWQVLMMFPIGMILSVNIYICVCDVYIYVGAHKCHREYLMLWDNLMLVLSLSLSLCVCVCVCVCVCMCVCMCVCVCEWQAFSVFTRLALNPEIPLPLPQVLGLKACTTIAWLTSDSYSAGMEK
jgi:hypothetical protein